MLNMTISNGWSFRWTENPETLDFFNTFFPQYKLPKRKTLGGRILASASLELQSSLENQAKQDKFGVMLLFDGWKNIIKQEILGMVLATSEGEILIWGAEDISGKRKQYAEIMNLVHELFEKFSKNDIKVNGLVTDSAPELAAARFLFIC
jgi:hypothetical protein